MATARDRTYRKRTLAAEPSRCHRCGRSLTSADLQAHHVQPLVDNGPPDWTVMLCVDCHRKETQKERVARSGGSRYVRVKPVGWPQVVQLLGFDLFAAAVAWDSQWRDEVLTGVTATGFTMGAYLGWAHRRNRRSRVLSDLSEVLAQQTRTMPHRIRIRVRQWDGRRPVKGQVAYSPVFRDREGSPARDDLEAVLTTKVGRPLRFTWYPTDNLLTWQPADQDGPPTPPQVDGRRAAAARIRIGFEAALGAGLIDFDVTEWDGDTPVKFTAHYPPQSRVHSDRVQDDVEDKVDAMLAGTWRAVWDTVNDRVTFTDTPDPLADVVTVAGELPATFDLSALQLGVREDGHPWTLNLSGKHGANRVLIGGAQGSGKGSVIWSLVHALVPAIQGGYVELWGIDPKSGMELGKGRQVWHQYADTIPAIVALLERAVETMQARGARLAARKVRLNTPSPAEPLIVVVIDEIASLTAYADRKTREKVDRLLGLLLSQGRAPGVAVIGALQDPRKEVLSIRDLFSIRIALCCTDKIQPDLILGDGMRAAGGRADRIAADQPGVAYVMVEGRPAPVRVRAAWVDDTRINLIDDTLGRRRREPAAGSWEPVKVDELDPDGGEWVRFDTDGATVEAETIGLDYADGDGGDTLLDYRDDTGRPRAIQLSPDEVLYRRVEPHGR